MRHFFSLHTERFLLTWLTLTVGKQRPHEYFAMEKEERCGCDCTDEILIRFSSRQASNAHGFVALSFVYSFVDKSFQGGRMLLTVLASRPKNGRALSSETWNFLAFLTCFFFLSFVFAGAYALLIYPVLLISFFKESMALCLVIHLRSKHGRRARKLKFLIFYGRCASPSTNNRLYTN